MNQSKNGIDEALSTTIDMYNYYMAWAVYGSRKVLLISIAPLQVYILD